MQKLFSALILSACAAWSKNAGQIPLREIDRPLVFPKGVWQELLVLSTSQRMLGVGRSDAGPVQGFLPSLPTLALTDRWTWMGVPAPYFEYLLLGKTLESPKGRVSEALGLSLRGGISGILYSSISGLDVNYDLFVRTKWPLSPRLWLFHSLGAGAENEDLTFVQNQLGLGWQITPRIYTVSRYNVSLISETYFSGFETSHDLDLKWSRTVHYVSQELGAHFTPNISWTLHPTYVYLSGESFLGFQSTIGFQW